MVSMAALRSFFALNRLFFPIKLHFGLYNAGTSTVQPAMPVYGKVLHFSSFVVGTVYAIVPILGLVLKPAICALADKMKWHRGVLLTSVLLVAVSYFTVQFIPPAERPDAPKMESLSLCSSAESLPYFLAETNGCQVICNATAERCQAWNFTATCLQYQLNHSTVPDTWCSPLPPLENVKWPNNCQYNCSKGAIEPRDDIEYEQEDSVTFSQWQFWVFLVLLTGSYVFNSIVTTLSDTVCIEITGSEKYGFQRLWGTLSWGVVIVINGYLIDAFSNPGEEKNYVPAFYLMLPFLVLDVVLIYYLKIDIPQQSQSIAGDVWKVCIKPRNLATLFWCATVGISFGIIWNFRFWYLEELAKDLGDPDVTANMKTIEGYVSMAECFIGEAPAFFIGAWVVSKLGHAHSLSLVMVIVGLRLFFYSILVNPWWCIPIELLQSDFGLFYSTITSYAKVIAPPGAEATVQSLLAALAEGVGVAIGSFLGGVLFDTYDGSSVMLGFAIAFVIAGILSEVLEFIFVTLEKKNSRQSLEQNGVQSISS